MCLTRGLSYSARGFLQVWIYGVDKFVLLLFNDEFLIVNFNSFLLLRILSSYSDHRILVGLVTEFLGILNSVYKT